MKRALLSTGVPITAAAPPIRTDLAKLIRESLPDARQKVALTALGQWRTVLQIGSGQEYASFDGDVFEANLTRYDNDQRVLSLASGTRNNRRVALRAISSLIEQTKTSQPRPSTGNTYWTLVRTAMVSADLTSDERGNLLKSHRQNRMPRSVAAVERVAVRVGLDPADLLPHVWLWQPTPLFDFQNPEYDWGSTHYDITQLQYRLDPLPTKVTESVEPFLTWRHAGSPRELAVRLLDGSEHVLVRDGAWSKRKSAEGKEWVPTAIAFCNFLEWFFGFLVLPTDHDDPRMRGLGKAEDQLRLTDLFVGANVVAFCKFQKRRNGRFDHTGLKKLRQDWCLIVGSDGAWGRYAQRALYDDLAHSLGGDDVPQNSSDWVEWCDTQLKVIDRWIETETEGRKGKNKYKKARSAEEALAVLLEKRAPMEEIVWPTILWLAANRPYSYYSVYDRLTFEQRIFTMVAFAAEPHRIETWSGVRWGKDLRLIDGKWHLTIPIAEFKNRRMLSRNYKSWIEPAAQPFFTAFYKIWKEAFGYDPLAREHVTRDSYVCAAWSRPNKRPDSQVHRTRLAHLSVIWGIAIAAQAFRHIWATDWLKRHPFDYATVAGKLNDEIKTIVSQYSHIYSEDHSIRAADANAGLEQKAADNLARLLRKQRKP